MVVVSVNQILILATIWLQVAAGEEIAAIISHGH